VARRVRLRPEVPDDLAAIYDYLFDKNAQVAGRFLAVVQPTLNDLASHPGKGSPKHFRNRRLQGIRTWSLPGFRNYLILYRPIEHGIDVLAIIHGSRNLARALKDRTT
jgi:plasmid stabilization system protein ParE